MEPVGLVLSVIATIDICLEYGQALVEMCRAFRLADTEIDQRVILIENSVYRTNEQLQLIQRMDADLEEDFKAMQIRLFKIFTAKLDDVIRRLTGLVDKDKDENGKLVYSIKRGKYMFVKQHLDSAINEMERWQTRFDPSWKLVMLRSAGTSVDMLLRRQDQISATRNAATPTFKDIGALRRMVRDGESSGVSVFLPAGPLDSMEKHSIPFSTVVIYRQTNPERHYIVDTIQLGVEHVSKNREKVMAKNVRSLAEKLHFVEASQSPNIGLLQCRGFVRREEGGFRFVFRQPERTEASRQPRSLRAMVVSGDEHSLTERINLAKQLARAVSYIHSLGFVHKNIRPETIIGFWIDGRSIDLECIYLTGFGHFRAEDGATSLLGDAEWERNLYRHPERQGVHPEEEYVMQHDIYGLGVCLLEIGLWTSLVAYNAEDNPVQGDILGSQAGRPSPTQLKSSLLQIARKQLPPKLGNRYRDIVVNCLTCLDEDNPDFADKSQFQDDSGIQIGVRYIEKIMLELEDIDL